MEGKRKKKEGEREEKRERGRRERREKGGREEGRKGELGKSFLAAMYACGLILNCIEYCFFISKLDNEN